MTFVYISGSLEKSSQGSCGASTLRRGHCHDPQCTGACQTYFPQPRTRHVDPGSILVEQHTMPDEATKVGMRNTDAHVCVPSLLVHKLVYIYLTSTGNFPQSGNQLRHHILWFFLILTPSYSCCLTQRLHLSPTSSPTTKSSNRPNSHRGQHLCTDSGFPFSPSPFQFPPQEVTTWTLEEHPMEEHSHLTPVSAPMSRTSPTNSGEILQQLVQVLTLLGQ